MAETVVEKGQEDVDFISATPRRRQITRWVLLGFTGILALLIVTIFALDTPPGRRFIIDRIEALEPANGLRIRIGRIDGSIYGQMTISDLRLYDPDGLFFEAPELEVDWQPLMYPFDNELHIRSLISDLVILHRAPALIPPEEEQPILPDFDIYLGNLAIERFRFEEAIAGERQHISLAANANIQLGRAQIEARANALDGGERLELLLDAEPDGDVFDVDMQLYAPEDGILAGLTGIERSLAVDIAGSGTWQRWDGRAQVDSGDARVIDLNLEARDGDFLLGGVMRSAALFDPGIVQRLTAPELNLTARATLEDRRLAGDFDIRSAAALIEGRGTLDLAENAFDGFVADIRLLDPSALVTDMRGTDVRMNLGLDGPFDGARFRYQLTAPRASIATTGFENLRVAGEGRWGEPPFVLPVGATASAITGLPDTFSEIVRNVALDGDLLITADQIVGDDLRLRSDRVRGDASIVYDLASGDYAAGWDGAIDRFALPGLGVFDIRTRVEVQPAPGGGFQIAGQARAVTPTLDNDFFQSLAGGATTVDTAIAYGPDGRFSFSNMQVRAPALRFDGSGYLDGDGQLSVAGSGEQTQYGPVTLTARGEPSRPRVELTLASPVPAAGIANVDAVLDPNANGYSYMARGNSMAGPFTSVGQLLLPADAPAGVNVGELLVADTRTEGRFAFRDGGIIGVLDLEGPGVTGDIELTMDGGEQLVVVDIDAENARLGGEIDATMRRALLDLRWRPLREAPTLQAGVELTGFRRRGISLARFGAAVQIDNGYGEADFDVGGARGRDFDFEAVAQIAPGLITVEGGGSFRDEPITLTPLVLRKEEEGWVVPESTIGYAGGGATVAARFGGPVTEVETTLDSIPLSVVDIFYPETGLGGMATGTLRYRQTADEVVPTANAELRIRSLTREGFALRPRPVNFGLNVRVEDERLATRAIMESDGEEILRFQSRIDPIAGAGNFGDLLATAPLLAELRYNGPSETLWQLTGNELFSLSGPLLARMDIKGTLETPRITGALETENARLESALTGTVVEGVTTTGTFRNARLEFAELSGTTPGGGTVSGRAAFDLGLATGFGMDIDLRADEAWLLRRDDISAQVTGPLRIQLQVPAGTAIGTAAARPVGTISGEFEMVRGEFMLGQAAPSIVVPQLNVVEVNRRIDDPDPRAEPIDWTLDIDVNARNRFMARGLGLDSEWDADIDVRGPLTEFQILGQMNLIRGGYQFAGRRFELERGRIEFYGNQPVDPVLDIVAEADVEGLEATINIGGTGFSPEITFTSVPALEQSELLSRLLFGTSITDLSAPEAIQLGVALASLQGGGNGLNPINAVRDAIGLDRLRILPADPAEDRGTAVAAGFYVTRRLFVEVITDGQGYSATETEFRITRWLSLLSSISTVGRVGGDIQISRDY
ncbi:translocation/assembly module TamB domain-containing protein [Parasphingopyxis sp.]|uniref:translocation/assembly module TamB domain-containing protein n=1 Tax=Parasphingopyxis sp. TaxID=1920299 RepID=UPI002637CA30|nr:translocation/assembly module TamB domain-containing protein [Parasphingopyxis sp.]